MSDPKEQYVLEKQVGYLMRLAGQRHTTIFQSVAPLGLTPTQFSALVKLLELGECSQNELGRKTAMDVATIKGVVDRLRQRDFALVRPDPVDKRRSLISLSKDVYETAQILYDAGFEISEQTLLPLDVKEREVFLALLKKLT
ncbi:MAG: MarR family winged helix-turn-helix transcriptional regulator [Paracoccaceae bacterium]